MNVVGIWLGYAALATPVVAGAFFWAVRCGQFRGQDRARRLALDAEPIGEMPSSSRWAIAAAVAPLVMAGAVLAMMGWAIWVSATHLGKAAIDAGS